MLTNLLSENMQMWFRKSIGSELYAQNLYRHLANQLERMGFFGAKKFYLKESAEEGEHYQRLADIVNEMGWVAPVPAVEAITDGVDSIGTALQIAYETEKDLMGQYRQFYEKAEDEDCALSESLLFFLRIQRESVGMYADLISRYERCLGNPAAILEFDEYMGEK